MSSSPIIVISGCTASGKSNVALKLAKRINGVILNADSRQIYKEVSIGTAKPNLILNESNQWEKEGITHYLYSQTSINKKYNLFKYQTDTFKILNQLPPQITPILTGGTGLYIDSVIFNYKLKTKSQPQTEVADNLSDFTAKELQRLVPSEILNKLNESDRQNKNRLIRVIQKGLPSIKKGTPLEHIYFFLDIEKTALEKRIEQRVNQMFKDGLLEENIKIRNKFPKSTFFKTTIGYKEFEDYFKKNISLDEVKEDIISHTKQYAKRQRTWFRRNKGVIYVKNLEEIEKWIRELYPNRY